MATATKTPAHLSPTTSGAKPAGLTKVTAAQWESLLSLSSTGQLSGVPPTVIAAIQQAEAPALGETWGVNSEGYGGGFGVGTAQLLPSELEDQSGAGYDAQAESAASTFANQLISNNGNVLSAEFAYQNGPNATPTASGLEGVKVFQSLSAVPDIISSHFGNGTGESKLSTEVLALLPGAGTSAGGVVPGLNFKVTETAAQAAASATAAAAAATPQGDTTPAAAKSSGVLSGIESDVHKDLEVAGYLLGGTALVIIGLILAFKSKSDNKEVGWLALWAGGMLLWATLTKRSPVCVFKAIVSGTDTTGCVGTISGGNLFAGTLTAIGAADLGSKLLGSGGSGGGGGGGGDTGEESDTSTAESTGSTAAEDVGAAAEDFGP